MLLTRKTTLGLALTGLGACLAAGPSHAAGPNIVQNPTFDQGLTNYTFTAATSGSDFSIVTGNGFSGGNSAGFGAVSTIDDSITQTLATVAGDNYNISYYLRNNGGPGNDFHATFAGNVLNPIVNANAFAYTLFTATATAPTSSTALEFSGLQNPSFFYLSDISVNDAGPAGVVVTPEPSQVASMGVGLFGLGGLMLRARKRNRTAA